MTSRDDMEKAKRQLGVRDRKTDRTTLILAAVPCFALWIIALGSAGLNGYIVLGGALLLTLGFVGIVAAIVRRNG